MPLKGDFKRLKYYSHFNVISELSTDKRVMECHCGKHTLIVNT